MRADVGILVQDPEPQTEEAPEKRDDEEEDEEPTDSPEKEEVVR